MFALWVKGTFSHFPRATMSIILNDGRQMWTASQVKQHSVSKQGYLVLYPYILVRCISQAQLTASRYYCTQVKRNLMKMCETMTLTKLSRLREVRLEYAKIWRCKEEFCMPDLLELKTLKCVLEHNPIPIATPMILFHFGNELKWSMWSPTFSIFNLKQSWCGAT